MARLPRSLFGRLLLLLLAGLVVGQLLSALILLEDRGQVLRRAVNLNVVQRIAALVELLDELPQDERRRVAAALDLPPTRISLDDAWRDLGDGGTPEGAAFAALLREYLPGRPLGVEVRVRDLGPRAERHLARMHAEHADRHRRHMAVRAFVVQVGLSGDGLVTFRHRLPEEVFGRPYRLLAVLAVLLASVVAVSALAARYLTRPLDRLAVAAAELGRDINRPPLDEARGPLEARRAARAFNLMQTRLRRYVQDRGRVLAAISHDLKTPITRLRLRSELLEDESLRAKFQADLDDMETMVQATLDFMRGTEHAEPVVPVDLGALLESLQEDYAESGGRIELEGRAGKPYPGRPLALKRCLTNLLDNALHYGRRARVRLADGPDRLTVTIADTGPGIPEGELERVFEPFYRLEGSRSRHTGGTGLGLGIARNIARAHGGELVLRNRPGGGLEAVLTLPR